MAGDLRQLAKDMERRRKQLPVAVNKVTKKVASTVLGTLVAKTPVDTSQALSNWQVGVGQHVTSSIPAAIKGSKGSTQGPSAAVTIAKGIAVIDKRLPGRTIFISNSLDYIEDLDSGRRSNAAGFVALAMQRGNAVLATSKLDLK